MSVVFKQGEQTFKASEVLWAKRDLINAIVEQALVGQTEAFIDMIIDGERPQDITRDSVNNILRGVKDSTQEFLNDMIGDLQRAIDARLSGATVPGATMGAGHRGAIALFDLCRCPEFANRGVAP